ncbi:hypothetical protein ACNKHX_15515 [Shigella flexneri]
MRRNQKMIIDAATLTGAAKIALGNHYHALFSFDDALAGRLLEVPHKKNEPFWRLPLANSTAARCRLTLRTEQYRKRGVSGRRSTAALPAHFVGLWQGWLHIDCSATTVKRQLTVVCGATGLGVRTIANLLTA